MISQQRAFILESALSIERNLSILLANILSVKVENSKTLGNKSSSLSFNTKADILLDTDYISKVDKQKFTLFMEIRNQFAHNKSCETYSDMLTIVDRCEKRLQDLFPICYTSEVREDQLQEHLTKLVDDLTVIITEVYNKYVHNLSEYLEAICNSHLYQGFKESVFKNLASIDKFFDLPITEENLSKFTDTFFDKIEADFEEYKEKGAPEIHSKIPKLKLIQLE
jgi:hypothetical protein